MQKVNIRLITLSILVSITAGCLVPEYKHTFLRSEDGQHVVTRLDYDGQTFFTHGKFESNSIPKSYIRPKFSGVNSGFEVILYFERDTAFLYAHYGSYESVGDNKRLKVNVYKGYGNDTLFYRMKDDNSGKYTVLHD